VLLPEAEAARLTPIQQAFREAGCRLAGAIFPALIEGTAFRDRGCWLRYATHFPFGMLLADREVIVRIPVALESGGSLFCIGEVPASSIFALLRAPELEAVRSVGRIAKRLGQNFGGAAGRDLLTFYCAGRRAHLGAEAVEELGELVRETRARRLVGALSLGEIGSVSAWGILGSITLRWYVDRWIRDGTRTHPDRPV
jgi:hypothetical protein